MFGGKFAANGGVKKPTIRRETVKVPIAQQPPSSGGQKPATSAARPATNRFNLSERSGARPDLVSKKPQAPAQRAIAASRGVKRKSTTPDRAMFSSDDEEDSSDLGASDSDLSRKRMKSSVSSVDSSGPRRKLVSDAAFGKNETVHFLHGAECTSGEQASKFKHPWEQEGFDTVELQYPSTAPCERFELKWPKNEKDDYKPMDDLRNTVKQIARFYLPEELSEKYLTEEGGLERRFNRAWQRQSIPQFKEIIEEFNSTLKSLVDDGTVQRHLAGKRHIPLDLVERILVQIYSRTVSPKVESLRAYQNGTDNVYGELLSRFCNRIFHETKLNHEHTFVDLGSGVGNVVLQAALEIGCESWGIEMMKNPCDLAELQAKEFPGRAHLWGLNVGKVHLIRDDFTRNAEISAVLKRADLVLINNQAFTPALNDTLRDMFLDLKDGCQVVTLKPIIPEGQKITMRNIDSVYNLFQQKRYEYFSDSVSWTDVSGFYYIATKDPRPLERFLRDHAGR